MGPNLAEVEMILSGGLGEGNQGRGRTENPSARAAGGPDGDDRRNGPAAGLKETLAMTSFLRLLPLLALLSASLPGQERMDYRDVAELQATLTDLARKSSHARLFTIGYGYDRKTDPYRPVRYPIFALRVSASTDWRIDDDPARNSVLFEAGMHAREWLATESCLALAEHLVANAENGRSHVPELLTHTDVWIIPLTDPGGRAIDDRHGGDPRRFSTSPLAAGWRGNADTRECAYGVNIARNFSRGWSQASAKPGADYRGFAPFSTEEAVALRNFVQNHGISMAVVVHTNAEKVFNMWGASDVAGTQIARLAQFMWGLRLDDPSLDLSFQAFGRGYGQFSDWLASPSNEKGQPDTGTVRGIQTIFLELPVLNANYGGRYRDREDDGSNGFHPSGNGVLDLIRASFLPMAEVLIQQGRSPGCPTLNGPWSAYAPGHDFGLTGAKLCTDANRAGALETYGAARMGDAVTPARDYLATGVYTLEYRVQRFGSGTEDDVDVRVLIERNGRVVAGYLTSHRDLSLQEVRTGRFKISVDRAFADYQVSLEARPAGGFGAGRTDDFTANDRKVFRFRSYTL